MRFYKLSPPRYVDDLEDQQRNPIQSASQYRVPGILCNICLQWSTSNRLRVNVPEHTATEFNRARFVAPNEWSMQVTRWATLLRVEPSSLSPGTKLGPPHGITMGLITADVVHPLPGLVWINENVRCALEAARFQGLQLVEVDLERGTEHPVPRLWEMVALGRGRTRRLAEEPLANCPTCGRTARAR